MRFYAVVLCISAFILSSCAINPHVPDPLSPTEIPASGGIDSTITVPARIDLSQEKERLEASLPSSLNMWGVYDCSRTPCFKYLVERKPFNMDIKDNVVITSTDVRYKLGVRTVLGKEVSCGQGAEWPRKAKLWAKVTISPAPDYGIIARLTGRDVNMLDSCALGYVGAGDAGDLLRDRALLFLNGGINNFVNRLNSMSFRTDAERAWAVLREPINIYGDAWLAMNPQGLSLSGFEGSDLAVKAVFLAAAQPVISHGQRPESGPEALRQLKGVPAEGGFSLVLDAPLKYAEISKTLNDALKGQKYNVDSREYIEIRSASVYSLGEDRVVLALAFDGTNSGKMYLTGRPGFDPSAQAVYLSDLRLDTYSRDLLLKKAGWLDQGKLIAFLEPMARFDAMEAINQARAKLQDALNRKVSDHLELNVGLKDAQGAAVFAGPEAILVRVKFSGSAELAAR